MINPIPSPEQEVATTNPDDNDDDDGGEDLLESLERDYQHIPELDTYGTAGLNDQDYDVMMAFLALSCEGMTAATRSKRNAHTISKLQ